jgi:hypothetical protein
MKPKDLKNSEELMFTTSNDAELIENAISDVIKPDPLEEVPSLIVAEPVEIQSVEEPDRNLVTEDEMETEKPDDDEENLTEEPVEIREEGSGSEEVELMEGIVPEIENVEELTVKRQEETVLPPEPEAFTSDLQAAGESIVENANEESGSPEEVEESSTESLPEVSPEVVLNIPADAEQEVVAENEAAGDMEVPSSPDIEQPLTVSVTDDDLSAIVSIKEEAEGEAELAGDINDTVDLTDLITPQEESSEPYHPEIVEDEAVSTESSPIEYPHEMDEIPLLEVKGDMPSASVYLDMTQVELINIIRGIVEGEIEEAGHDTDAIIAVYYRKAKEKSDELKRKFLADGGKAEDYAIDEDPYSLEVRELVRKYRQLKFDQAKKLDVEKETNLRRKYEIIEEIKNLLNKEESINRTFQEFRELQKKWYEIGQVPQNKMKDIWDTYHFHVENFYDYIKINKELRDLDLKKNLEIKMELCEKAEELLMEPSVIKAFNNLQKFHEEWREIGPVPSDKKEEIWERFKATTSKINQKHQDYFEKRKLDQKKNLDAKIALCERAEEISSIEFESHREWDDKSRDLVELQKVWKTIGFAPKKENNKVYDRFRAACDKFFALKREYYSRNKDVQQTNLQMKVDLCMEAETLKESNDWKKATQQFIDIQKRWKEIGPVPRKSSDAIWKRFRAACDFFFEKKSIHFSEIDGEQYENLKLKEQIIVEVESFKPDNDATVSLRILRDFQRRWTEIGHVPLKNKDVIQHRFREAINKQFDGLKVDYTDRSSFSFRNKIEALTDNVRGLSKVRSEREKYMAKLKQLETDLSLLDNNIGFFANSKNAQALIADVNQKIVDTREKIEQLKDKIRIIDELDKSDY